MATVKDIIVEFRASRTPPDPLLAYAKWLSRDQERLEAALDAILAHRIPAVPVAELVGPLEVPRPRRTGRLRRAGVESAGDLADAFRIVESTAIPKGWLAVVDEVIDDEGRRTVKQWVDVRNLFR